MPENDPVENLRSVKDAMASALAEAGRAGDAARLVAVTKKFDAERIRPVLEAGHRLFGENRVQEAESKWPALRETWPDITLHLIGPLQTNKVKEAVALFDVIETVDRPKLANHLAGEMERTGKRPACFIQVNTGEEPQKAGVTPQDALDFVRYCREEAGLPVTGLMCIPPADAYPAPHFALLHKLAGEAGLKEVSMGMSGDFEMACQLGATLVRVGTGIFGTRPDA